MAFCVKCGAELGEGAAFCVSCGEPVAAAAAPAAPQAQAQGYVPPAQGYAVPPVAGMVDPDVQQNKFMAVLSYLGLLVLIPWFAAPQSRFARFHAKEGFKLLFTDIAASIVVSIPNGLLGAIFREKYNFSGQTIYSYPGWLLALQGVIWSLYGIAVLVVVILGIVNAAQGQFKKLPVLGTLPLWQSIPFLKD